MAADVLPSSREGLLRLLYEEDRLVVEDRIVVAAALGLDLNFGLALPLAKRELEKREVLRDALRDAWQMLSRLEKPLFPLRGRDVLGEGGIAAGPQVGELLGEVEAWWAARDFVPHREQCLEEARRLLRRRGAIGA